MDQPQLRVTRTGWRALLCACFLGAGLIASAVHADPSVPGQVQVRLRPGASIAEVNARYGTSAVDSLPSTYLLRLPEGMPESEILARMKADPDIVESERAWLTQTPEGLRQTMVAAVGGTVEEYLGQDPAERIRLGEIHPYTRGQGIKVAVLDGGVRADHPALAGFIDPDGWDFVDGDSDPSDEAGGLDEDLDGTADEAAGHGTMVAGIVHLVAPEARILPVRVLNDEGFGRSFDVAKGIVYAIEHGARVINMSFGLYQGCYVIQRQLVLADSLGVLLVSSAGNENSESPELYPAGDIRVLSVTALDSLDVKADFSNYNRHAAIAAPGTGILSTYLDGAYAVGAGTSFSAPFVAGQLALILSARPDLGKRAAEAITLRGVVDVDHIPENEPWIGMLGSGRIDGVATWNAISEVDAVPTAGSLLETLRLVIVPNPVPPGSAVRLRVTGATAQTSIFYGGIFDISGRRVREFSLRPSAGTVDFAAVDARGEPLRAGVYFVQARDPVTGATLPGRFVMGR
jgi:subtilisin family serine protease